jgi:hypothetical protein
MPRLIIHNYPTRSLGRFRATAAVRDNKHDCGCGCGGNGDCGHSHDSSAKADVAIDVRYFKGGYGRPKVLETKHYVVSDVVVNSRGRAPSPEFVRAELYKQPGHKVMRREGWDVDDITGYYKSENRDTGQRI